MVDFAFDGVGDGSGLFGDDDADDIELLGDADGAAVAQAEVGVDVGARGDGEDAPRGEHLVAAHDDGSVVQRGVFEEERLDECGGGHGVDGLAGAHQLFHFVAALEDDEGAGLALRHVHAGLDVGFEVGAAMLVDVAAPELEPLGEGVAGDLRLGADEEEEFAYLGLEDDDEGDEANAHDAAQYLAAETHAQRGEDAPGDVHDEEGPENTDDVGAFQHAIEVVYQHGYHEDVEDVDKSDVQKGNHTNIYIIEN